MANGPRLKPRFATIWIDCTAQPPYPCIDGSCSCCSDARQLFIPYFQSGLLDFLLTFAKWCLVLSYAIVFDTVNTSQDVRRDARGILTFSLFAPIQIACVSCDFLKVNLNPKQLIVRSLHCWILRYSITIDNLFDVK